MAAKSCSPDMHGAVIPALPAIGVADLLRPSAAQLAHKKPRLAVGTLHQFTFAVAVSLG